MRACTSWKMKVCSLSRHPLRTTMVAVVSAVALTTMFFTLRLNSGSEHHPASQAVSSVEDATEEPKAQDDTEHRPVSKANNGAEHVDRPPRTPVEEDMDSRLERVRAACNASKTNGSVAHVFVNDKNRLAYCFLPKTGCTFWKRVFAFLNNDTDLKTPIHSPFDIPRMYIHTYKNGYGYNWNTVKNRVGDYFRFMFTRDPYTRLWSSYLDKFFLPDFWNLFNTRLSRSVPNGTANCRIATISFAEFVEFSLRVNEPHWATMSSQCNPCAFRPDFLGKIDTFSRDTRVILDKAGIGWILDDVDRSGFVQKELEMLIRYNFELISRPLVRRCITDTGLGFRLWKTFQYNGYISENFPYQPPSPFTVVAFQNRVLEASAKSQNMYADELKRQKSESFENAFRTLSASTLPRIAAKYDLDFKRFGYTPRYWKNQ